jgi:UDP-glucose 4-epimerase
MYIQSRVSTTFKAHILRSFNVVGSDPEGRLDEHPVPSLAKYSRIWTSRLDVIFKRRQCVELYDSTLDTPDGTAIRDYVHVTDLVQTHVLILNRTAAVWNVGSGVATSTLKFVEAARRVSQTFIPICFGIGVSSHRPPQLYASAQKIIDARVRHQTLDPSTACWRPPGPGFGGVTMRNTRRHV